MLIILRTCIEFYRMSDYVLPPESYMFRRWLTALTITTLITILAVVLSFYEKYKAIWILTIGAILFLIVYKMLYLA